MNAEIICVGSEVLAGDTINTNASVIAKGLSDIGIETLYHSVVGDDDDRLEEVIRIASKRVDLIITTGGLGPTYDDMTKAIIAKVFDRNVVYDDETMKHIEDFFKWLNRPMTENNKRQAQVIEGSDVLKNDTGLAPGMCFKQDNNMVVLLPGPPDEMGPMFNKYLIPRLKQDDSLKIVSESIRVFGVGESQIETVLHDLMVGSTNPIIAPYAKRGEVMLKVTARAKTEEEAKALIKPVHKAIFDAFYKNIYTTVDINLESALVRALKEKEKNIAIAESCTGGIIASRLTTVPGASAVFGYGVVTYANEAKQKILGVREKTLIDHGAVSEQTAEEMAKGVLKISGADIGIAVTGIAGPDGGTEEKPVGLVYVGVATKEETVVKKLMLSRRHANEREIIRQQATANALFLALKTLKDLK